MDIIDKLRKRIKYCYEDFNLMNYDNVDTVARILAEDVLDFVTLNPNWNSCERVLPHDIREKLCYDKHYGIFIAYYSNELDKWFTSLSSMMHADVHVDYWMDLPNKPIE